MTILVALVLVVLLVWAALSLLQSAPLPPPLRTALFVVLAVVLLLVALDILGVVTLLDRPIRVRR